MSTESTLGDSEEIERLTQLNEELNSTNNRLAMEIDSKDKQIQDLQATIQGNQKIHGDIQSQSIEQIRSLGEENKNLKQELLSLRTENALLKSQNDAASQDQSKLSLQQEIDRLKKELELLKAQQSFQSQQYPASYAFSRTLDLDRLSPQELRSCLESDHTQLGIMSDQIRHIEEIVDSHLRETLPAESLPAADATIYRKLDLLVASLRSSSVYAAEIADLREKAETNFQCSQEWENEAARLQDQLAQAAESSDYLRACVDCAQHYLARLVGSDFSQHLYEREFLESQFQLVCRRSEKLLAEYQSLRQRLARRAPTLAQPDAATLERVKRLIARVGERLNFLERGAEPSWAALEGCLQDLFTFADVVVPKTRETLVQKDGEIRRLQRELKRVRPFEASGLLSLVCSQTRHRITLPTGGLDAPTLLCGQTVYSASATPRLNATSSPANTLSSATPSSSRSRHPTIEFRTTQPAPSSAPSSSVAFSTTQPCPSFTRGPSTTFGPTQHSAPTSAVACYLPARPRGYLQHVPARPRSRHQLALARAAQRLRRARVAPQVLQKERGALQIVARLADVHPEPAQHHAVQLLVRCHLRKDLSLDRRRPVLPVTARPGGYRDAADHRGAEQVDARVYVVPHVLLRLLHEAVDEALGSDREIEATVSSATTTPYFDGSSVQVT